MKKPSLLLRMWMPLLLAVQIGCSDDDNGQRGPGAPRSPEPVLGQSVEVYRDEWGIPHIYAQNRADMVFMQGYEMAWAR